MLEFILGCIWLVIQCTIGSIMLTLLFILSCSVIYSISRLVFNLKQKFGKGI